MNEFRRFFTKEFAGEQWARLRIHLRKLKLQYRNYKEKYPRRTKIALWTGMSAVAGISLMVFFCCLVYWGTFGKLPAYPDLRAIQNYTASQVYSKDSVLLGKYYIENRLNADSEELSPHLLNALVATEDARFFDHSGIDIRAWVRVFFKTILLQNESAGGGSTLSQQLAKNLFPRQDYGILSIPVNKVKEMFVARRLEKIYSKEELLNLYFNTVPFSENIYGVKVASHRFFNTSPKYLKPEQAAVLVGMLKGTAIYNPARFPERARERRNVVLHQMSRYGYLNPVEEDSISSLPLELNYQPEGNDQGLATYFREHLRLELDEILEDYSKPDGSVYNLYTDGLKIYTTIDSRLQHYAEDAVKAQMYSLQKDFDKHWKGRRPWGSDRTLTFALQNSERYKKLKEKGLGEGEIDSIFKIPVPMTVFNWEKGSVETEMTPLDSVKYSLSLLHAGFLAMEPGTGEIKAWVGGIDHHFFKYDHVKSRRQAGSTYKPLVYLAALMQDIPPCDYIDNLLVSYPDHENWTPENADGDYEGVYSMEGGLSNSVNTVTVDLAMRTGIDKIQSLGKRLKMGEKIPAVPSIALGVVDVSLMELVNTYATFAERGFYTEPIYLLRIENAKGEVVVDFQKEKKQEKKRILPEEETAMLTRMLQTVVDSGTASRLRWEFGLYGDIAGKTGTTQDNSDGWFVGYTPKLVAGVWIGGELPEVRFRSLELGQGSNTALPVWGRFYKSAMNDPAFAEWKKVAFTPLPDSLQAMLDCPLYLEERPFLEELLGEDGWRGLFGRIFRSGDEQRDTLELHAENRQQDESQRQRELSEESKRIREHNERLERKRERQKRRKEFWDNLFGREQ